MADAPTPEDIFGRLVSHWPDPQALVLGSRPLATAHTDPTRWPSTAGIVEHMMAVDTVTYLPDDILAKVDRSTMSVSLESRLPLLDRDIDEFAASLPVSSLIEDGRSKAPLRRVLDRYVPVELVDRPKAGFGLPIEEWLRGPLREWSADRLFGPTATAHLDASLLRTTWDEHQRGRFNHAYRLWDVLMFVEWADSRGVAA